VVAGFQGSAGNFSLEFLEITNKLVGYTRNINGEGVQNILLTVECSGFSGQGTSGLNGLYQIPIPANVSTASCTITPDTIESGFSLWESDPSGQNFRGKFPPYTISGRLDGLPANISAKPGMSASAHINAGKLTDALLVPLPAVTAQDGNYFCYVMGKESIERRAVTIGDNTESFVEITDGVQEGEQVLLNARARSVSEIRSPAARLKTQAGDATLAAAKSRS
jgi:hypothetical protein